VGCVIFILLIEIALRTISA